MLTCATTTVEVEEAREGAREDAVEEELAAVAREEVAAVAKELDDAAGWEHAAGELRPSSSSSRMSTPTIARSRQQRWLMQRWASTPLCVVHVEQNQPLTRAPDASSRLLSAILRLVGSSG